jgi:ketosteroid isomerase-like protein
MIAIDTVKRFYSALAARDIATLSSLFADHLAWTEAEGFPFYSGTWTSFAEVAEKLLGPLARDWDNFAATPIEFLATGDDRVVTIGAY